MQHAMHVNKRGEVRRVAERGLNKFCYTGPGRKTQLGHFPNGTQSEVIFILVIIIIFIILDARLAFLNVTSWRNGILCGHDGPPLYRLHWHSLTRLKGVDNWSFPHLGLLSALLSSTCKPLVWRIP